MSNDILTQLAEYGSYHRETQQPVDSDSIGVPVAKQPAKRGGPGSRWLVPLAAAVVVAALFVVPSLLRDPERQGAVAIQVEGTAFESQGLTSVHRLPASGDLAALQDGRLVMSSDNGQEWTQISLGEYVLLAVAPDGSVVAVAPQQDIAEPVGPGSMGSKTPTILRFDPATGEGETVQLPRPEMPPGELAPAPSDGSCGPGGLRSEILPIAAASGPQIAIVGDHRITTADICDETRQFIWTSTDGLSWSIIPEIGLEGYITALLWDGEKYVASGSTERPYHRTSDPSLLLWTSPDLDTMTREPVEQPSTDEDEIFYVPTEVEGNDDRRDTIWVDSDTGSVVVTVQLLRYRPGLEDVTNLDELTAWLNDAGASPQAEMVDQILDDLDMAPPFDQSEIDTLRSSLVITEPAGYLDIPTDITADE